MIVPLTPENAAGVVPKSRSAKPIDPVDVMRAPDQLTRVPAVTAPETSATWPRSKGIKSCG